MTNELTAILEISKLCKENDITATIDEKGIILKGYRHGKEVEKRFNLEDITIISMNLPLIVLFDLFIEEQILRYQRA
jgi:hypothetical protein